MRTYKVVSVDKPKMFKAMSPKDFEDILNREAADGWIYQGEMSRDYPAYFTENFFLLIFYREV